MKTKLPRFKTRTRYILLIVTLVVLVAALVAGIVILSTVNFSAAIRESRAKAVVGAAKLAVTEINADKIDYWYENGKDAEYRETENELNEILYSTPYLQYLYVYKILPDGCHVIFDFWSPSDSDRETPPSQLGDFIDFDPSFEPLIPDLLAGREIDLMESNDTYGWLLTQYEPIYDSTGKCVAYVGVDISILEIYEYTNHILMKIISYVMLFSIFSLLIGIRMSMLARHADQMDAIMEKSKRDRKLLDEFITAFATVIDLKDSYTQGHSFRVAEYTEMLSRELGYDDETVERYHNIALLHDIGKIGIPDEVLNKPGKLSEEEFALIKSHTTRGYDVLKNISLMPEIAVGAQSHHERPDGKGYHNGLKEGEIPRVAQIIAVADTFDAMYSTRKYRKRMNFEKVVSVIKEAKGTQLEGDVVDAFLRIVDRGGFRAEDDFGGGSEESIDNISGQKSE